MFRKLCQLTGKTLTQQQLRLQKGGTCVNYWTRNVALANTGKPARVPLEQKPIPAHTTLTRSIQSSGPSITTVTYEYIKELPSHPEKLLIDVREPEELQNTGRIPTSINIPLGSLEQALAPAADPSEFTKKYSRHKPLEQTEIIFCCQMGKRSTHAANAALSLGYNNVKNYVGSWVDWAEHEGIKN